MPTEIKLPRLGQGMDEGKILKWLKAEGDSVDKGEEIYEVETEKVNIEVESPGRGTLLKIVHGEGDEVPIGTVIGWLGEPGESVPESGGAPAATTPVSANGGASKRAQAASAKAAPKPAPKAARATSAAASSAPQPSAAGTGGDGGTRVKASPLARRMAAEQGIDLAAVAGTGPDGRIIARDLGGLATSADESVPQSVEGGERVPLSSMRRTIARRLTEAWQAPAFYLTVDVDMEAANELRKRLVATMAEGDVKPTVSDIITKACAVALRRHPDMNVHFAGDAIIRFRAAHVGMAVATDAGLVVPVIRDAHAKSVRELASDRKALVDKARTGKLVPSDFEGGTFTISNLGMMGIDEFTAVLNPPMAGILAVGRTKDVVVPVNRRPEVRPMMTINLGCDHRAVDGAVGARFLATVKSNLEDPLTML